MSSDGNIMSPPVTALSLRAVADEFQISARKLIFNGWPDLAKLEREIADHLTEAAELLDQVEAARR